MSILRASACRTSCPRCFDMNKTELKNAAIDSIESMADFYEKNSRWDMGEPRAFAKGVQGRGALLRILREHGFNVREKLCGIDTAFCGSFGSGRPYIGILGEFDALSGLSQKAGSCEKDPVVQDVSWLTPAAQIETATWPSGMPLHTWQTIACGKSSIAYKGMLCAGKVMAASAIDLIEAPELLKAAREEFKRRAKGGYTCPIEPETVPTAL